MKTISMFIVAAFVLGGCHHPTTESRIQSPSDLRGTESPRVAKRLEKPIAEVEFVFHETRVISRPAAEPRGTHLLPGTTFKPKHLVAP